MIDEEILGQIVTAGTNRIALIVLDGVGDLPYGGKTPLEAARTPMLDSLAKKSALGMHIPVEPGIIPGSGPGHLGLFGYDPVANLIGRGVLEAVGIGMEVEDTDIAIRGNFCTAEEENGQLIIVDRRAGRIPTEKNAELVSILRENIQEIEGVQVIFNTVREHRFVVILRFPHPVTPAHALVTENDPQKTGEPELKIVPEASEAQKTAEIVHTLLTRIREVIGKEQPANYALLRGFSVKPVLTPFYKRYLVRALAIAAYPMYRGIAKLVGMDVAKERTDSIEDEINVLKKYMDSGRYDFFFVHIKKTDSYGEDGNFEKKVSVIEEFDTQLAKLFPVKDTVLCITGDHSTPCIMKSHSWHPVPLLIHSPYVLGSPESRFTERDCLRGELGIIRSRNIMLLLLAHAERLKKFGA